MDAFDEDAFLVRRSGRVLGAAATVVALGAAVAGSVGFVALGFWVAWVGLGALVYGWTRSPGAAPQAVHVRADAQGLDVEGLAPLPASRIQGGWLQPRPHGSPIVHVRALGGRHVRLAVRDVEQGRSLLRALRLDAAHVSAHYWAMARPLGEPRAFAHAAVFLGLTIVIGLVVGPDSPPIFSVALVALVVMFAGVVVPTRVIVGGDGVLLRWLGTVRFVPWSRVTDVEVTDGGVVLSLGRAPADRATGQAPGPTPGRPPASFDADRKETLTLRMPEDHERYQPERDAMIERMVSALRAHGPPSRPEPMARLLGRAGGRTREWVRAMRAIVRPTHSFRAATVPVERLWSVVEDPRADREARTGAAIALAPTLVGPGQARLRAVAEGCAEPRLRIALTTAVVEARAPDEALAEALDALESEGEDGHARRP